MQRSHPRLVAFIALVSWLAVTAVAQQPPPKSPTLPPINPAVARLESTIDGLSSPAVDLVYQDSSGLLGVACENREINWWYKDALLGFRAERHPSNQIHAHQGPLTALTWNGGPVLASAATDRKLVLWSLQEAKPLHTIAIDHFLRTLALAPDGKLLAGGGDDPSIQLWDVAEGKAKSPLKDHTDWVTCLAFSPDGKLLASGGYDTVIRLWDVAGSKKVSNITGQPTPLPKDAPTPALATSLTFAPDSKTLFIGRADGSIEQVNVADGKLIRKLTGHGSTITGLVLHPTATLLVSSSKDRTIRLWNPANGAAIKTLEGHEAWVQGVVFIDHATRLASVSADRTVRVWALTEPPKK